MAVFDIRVLPNPVLREKARRVSTIDSSIKKLIADMQETLHAEPGRAGLAAPQIGVSLRIAVISIDEKEDTILINPEIVKRSGERQVTEGCLSVPGYYAEITRAESVTAKALDQNGKPIRIKAKDLMAQALEHETDHLNGILYIDYLKSMDMLRKVGEEDSTEL